MVNAVRCLELTPVSIGIERAACSLARCFRLACSAGGSGLGGPIRCCIAQVFAVSQLTGIKWASRGPKTHCGDPIIYWLNREDYGPRVKNEHGFVGRDIAVVENAQDQNHSQVHCKNSAYEQQTFLIEKVPGRMANSHKYRIVTRGLICSR